VDERDFYLRVAEALSACQLVEQELKLYIAEALELVAKCVDSRVPFKMTGQDYEDASLERLIEMFSKLTDHPGLVAALRKFKDERNFLSHRGISHCLGLDEELDYAAAAAFEAGLAAIAPEARQLRVAIHEEANKFRGHLWFGFPDDAA
jgi:hypothetical protein